MDNIQEQEEQTNFEEYPQEEDSYSEEKYTGFGVRSQLLTVLQLTVCILILGAAFVIKLIGGDIYGTVGTWFYDNYNNSVFTGTTENVFGFADFVSFTETSTVSPEAKTDLDDDTITNLKAKMKMPLKSGTVTSPFGEREDGSEKQVHKGIDIGAEKDCEIYAMLDGKVITAEKDESYGNYIILSHENGVNTLYAHCSKMIVKKGDTVKAGQKIALVGSTGDSDGNHLHLEIIVDGKNIDPQKILGEEYT